MKKIESIIRPHLLEVVKNALQEVGVVRGVDHVSCASALRTACDA